MVNGIFVNMDGSYRAPPTMTPLHIMVQICVSNTISVALFFFFFFLSLLFISEREREGRGREREKEGDRIQRRLQALSHQHRARRGLEPTNHEIMTWAKVRCSTDWVTQAPLCCPLKEHSLSFFSRGIQFQCTHWLYQILNLPYSLFPDFPLYVN